MCCAVIIVQHIGLEQTLRSPPKHMLGASVSVHTSLAWIARLIARDGGDRLLPLFKIKNQKFMQQWNNLPLDIFLGCHPAS